MARDETNRARIDDERAALQTRHGDGGSVATVTWIGYQAPQLSAGGVLFDSTTVLRDHAAQQGADRLAPFPNGIDASRDVDPHLTALGHSCGSTTTGLALRQNTGVDDAVFSGSPGLGTGDVQDLGVPTGHTNHEVSLRDGYGAELLFGTARNTTLSVSTGCHLTPRARGEA